MTSAETGPTSPSKSNVLLDVGILVQYLRGNRRAADLLNALASRGMPFISVITVTEILMGSVTEAHMKAAYGVISSLQVIPITFEIAEKTALLIQRYPASFGKQVTRGIADAYIAATAWSNDHVLYTLNTQDFAKLSIAEIRVHAIDQNAPKWA